MKHNHARTRYLLILSCLLAALGCGQGSAPDNSTVPGTTTESRPEMTAEPTQETSATPAPETETAAPATLITWQHSGGIAGICRGLTIFADGSYSLVNCMSDQVIKQGQLDASQFEKLDRMAPDFAPFEWETKPSPNSADMFSMSLRFEGTGSEKADEHQRDEIAKEIFALVNQLGR